MTQTKIQKENGFLFGVKENGGWLGLHSEKLVYF